MDNLKNRRLAEDIKREISTLIMTEIKDPRVRSGFISVVRVDLSGDNSHCGVYISSIDGIDAAKSAAKVLEGASWIMKKAIADKLHMRKSPELKFIADDSIEHSVEIDRLIDSISAKRAEQSDADEPDNENEDEL